VTGALLLAAVVAVGGEGVPDDVVARSRDVVARMLGDPAETVHLEVHAKRDAMLAAVRELDPSAVAEAGYFHRKTRTIFVHLAPRADEELYRDGLPGALLAALAHEAAHARDALAGPRETRPAWQVEGEANRTAVAWLADHGGRGAGALALLLASNVRRAREAGLFLPSDRFERIRPERLDEPARATWYAQAYARAAPDVAATAPAWVLWRGSAEPSPDQRAFRLIAEPGRTALLVRTEPDGPLDLDVTPLALGTGRIEIVFGFRSADDHAKAVLTREGGVRAAWCEGGRWTRDPEHRAPPLPAGRTVRVELRDGVLRVDGRVVLHVLEPPGRCGIGVFDAAADFRLRRRP